MHRTQLFLDNETYRALTAAATREGKTLSAIAREKLHRALKAAPLVDPAEAVAQAFGLWANRKDLPNTEAFLRRLRKDRRILGRDPASKKSRRR